MPRSSCEMKCLQLKEAKMDKLKNITDKDIFVCKKYLNEALREIDSREYYRVKKLCDQIKRLLIRKDYERVERKKV